MLKIGDRCLVIRSGENSTPVEIVKVITRYIVRPLNSASPSIIEFEEKELAKYTLHNNVD